MAALKNVIILYTVAEVSARLGPMECVRLPTLLLVDKWGLAGKLVVGSSGRLFEMWHMIGSSSWMVASCTKARVERRVPRLGPSDAQFSRSRSSRKDEELWFVASGGKLITSSVPLRLNSHLVLLSAIVSLSPKFFRHQTSLSVVFRPFAVESPCFPSEPSGTPLSYRIELNLVHRYGILNKVRRIKAYCSVRTVCTISIGEWDRRYIGMPHYTVFSLSSGKAPYRPVCTGPVVDRYVDRPLSGGTAKRRSIEGKIDRRRSISAVGGRLRRNREGKKKKKRKRKKKK
ncbi:hypothetical protein GW17_00028829 [Ensete ventricosum]|nr:hypothetical protein GW17_00028829 [Ensete ventricosum]